jgi:hypothetical protein
MEDFPVWLKLTIWLMLGAIVVYAVLQTIFSLTT